MPEKNYKIYLNEVVRIIIYFDFSKGKIINFVVKLEYYYKNKWVEVERYDCFHGYVHKDILDRKGNKKKVIKYKLVEKKSGLNFAIKDFKENYEFLVWRFLNDKR